MRSDYTLVHVLIPDMQMRFPGDPGCDMSFFSYAALRCAALALFAAPFYTKNDHLTKTGSGQT
jgi:hypothetical protein